ncbi:hypothetical protein [Xanthomonas populi]|uniref:hypothetical protein n=1 Tax=Xanthomonas populi TaxID=53414 RepID=UPI001304B256|nr:hypothetical protein [Xanthomonas populi]
MQPVALAGASSAPPGSVGRDIDDWLVRSLPMAEQINTGYKGTSNNQVVAVVTRTG